MYLKLTVSYRLVINLCIIVSGECQNLGWVDILVYIYSDLVLLRLEQILLPLVYGWFWILLYIRGRGIERRRMDRLTDKQMLRVGKMTHGGGRSKNSRQKLSNQ